MSHPLSFIAQLGIALETSGRENLAAALRELKRQSLSDPAGSRQFGEFLQEIRNLAFPQITLEKEGDSSRTVVVEPGASVVTLRGILPGHYCAYQSTGRLLWKRRLSETDLFWEYAFPLEDLPMAASTDDAVPRHSLHETLLTGELSLWVFPGVRAGALGFQLRGGS